MSWITDGDIYTVYTGIYRQYRDSAGLPSLAAYVGSRYVGTYALH